MLKKFDSLATLLLTIGAIAWGLMGLYQLNIVTYVFNEDWLIRLIYVFFGIAFVYRLVSCSKHCKNKTKR